MPNSSQLHRLQIGIFRSTARDDFPKTSSGRYRKNNTPPPPPNKKKKNQTNKKTQNKTKPSNACQNTVTKETASWFACATFSILYCTCLLLLIISMAVDLNPRPCDKACRIYIDRHQQSIETKIQQLFNCIRQQGDTLDTQTDHKFEQLHEVLEHVHDIHQLKKQCQEDRTNIDQLLEDHNSAGIY